MINRFLIEFTDQRNHEMDKKYLRALGLPLFLIFCVLIPLLVFILTSGLEDQPIIVVAAFVISVSIGFLTFFTIEGDAKDVYDEMLTYSIVKETSERKVIFDREVDNDEEMLYVDMFVNGYKYYFSTKDVENRGSLMSRIKSSKYASLRIVTKGMILPSKRVYFGNQIVSDSEIPDKFLKDQIETIEIYEAIVKIKVGKNIFTETTNVIDIEWSIKDEKEAELKYRIAKEAEERLKI
jgi:hypothetical protein